MRKVDGFVVSSGAGSCIYLVRTYVGLTTKLGANFELRTSGLLLVMRQHPSGEKRGSQFLARPLSWGDDTRYPLLLSSWAEGNRRFLPQRRAATPSALDAELLMRY
jgi:hypothetical protein